MQRRTRDALEAASPSDTSKRLWKDMPQCMNLSVSMLMAPALTPACDRHPCLHEPRRRAITKHAAGSATQQSRTNHNASGGRHIKAHNEGSG